MGQDIHGTTDMDECVRSLNMVYCAKLFGYESKTWFELKFETSWAKRLKLMKPKILTYLYSALFNDNNRGNINAFPLL